MDFIKREKKAQNLLKKLHVDALILDNPIDINYLSGVSVSFGRLAVLKNKILFFTDGRYLQSAKNSFHGIVLQYSDKSFVRNLNENRIKTVGFDAGFTSYFSHEKLCKLLKKRIQLKPIVFPLKELRLIKDKEEIATMKRALHITYLGYLHIKKMLKVGVTERRLADEFKIFCLKNNAATSFDPIVAFGINSACPHHMPGSDKLKKDMIVLMDLGAELEGYAADMTRMVFFGKVDKRLRENYLFIKEAHDLALQFCKPNVKVGMLDQKVRGFLKKKGKERFFMHGLGHGVGKEVHEPYRIKQDGEDKEKILKEGMVFTIEPGIYENDIGGVRYENMFLITKDGYKNLIEDFEK